MSKTGKWLLALLALAAVGQLIELAQSSRKQAATQKAASDTAESLEGWHADTKWWRDAGGVRRERLEAYLWDDSTYNRLAVTCVYPSPLPSGMDFQADFRVTLHADNPIAAKRHLKLSHRFSGEPSESMRWEISGDHSLAMHLSEKDSAHWAHLLMSRQRFDMPAVPILRRQYSQTALGTEIAGPMAREHVSLGFDLTGSEKALRPLLEACRIEG